ncbi:hypothetical protein [Pseudomonas serbica]|uniref:hypothetical protein n=1 Tax=Pseudomonas serbica TaxID=2965074 RepID=UPI00237A185B|nr:hypothetical protein [Pseudomonas serbica]
MNYNREYSKRFGTGLMALGLAILVAFGSFLLNFDVWGAESHTFLPCTILVAFSSVATFFTGAAFRRGVFLMSEQVIKPPVKQGTPSAAA